MINNLIDKILCRLYFQSRALVMDGCFLKLFFDQTQAIRPKQCSCHEKSMETLKCEMIQNQVTFKSIQTMLKSIPPDLRIICEDKSEFFSHKILFGLMNTTLASIFLEDEFINEIVTLFMPTESEHLETMLNDEFLLKSQLKNITSLQCPAGSKDIDMKYLNESGSIELIKAEGRHHFKEEEEDESRETDMGNVKDEEEEIMPKPMRITFKKQERKKEKKLPLKENESGINFDCEQCDYQATTQTSLTKHIKSVHESAIYVCDQCDYMTMWQSNLTNHIKVKHECVRYACDQCDYQAKQKHHLGSHIKSKHEGVKYYCDQCDYQATQQANLNAHIKSKHEGVKYPCEQCGKKFTSQSSLTHHIRSKHDGVKYVCDQCDYQATQKGDLNIHIRNKHEGVKFYCEQCGQQFTAKSNLIAHIRTQHKGVKTKLFK